MTLVRMNLVADDFKLHLRATPVIENVMPGLEFALEQADGGTVEGAVRLLVI
jgi:hypothetical protein